MQIFPKLSVDRKQQLHEALITAKMIKYCLAASRYYPNTYTTRDKHVFIITDECGGSIACTTIAIVDDSLVLTDRTRDHSDIRAIPIDMVKTIQLKEEQ